MSNELVPRRYSEKEAGTILRKAAEMQRAEPTATDPSGFSLAELEEVAREAGIDPAVVRSAAAELDVPAAENFSAALVGGRSRFDSRPNCRGNTPLSVSTPWYRRSRMLLPGRVKPAW